MKRKNFLGGDYMMTDKELIKAKEILKENLDRCVRIPMSDKVRSLNLSNCAALTIYEVLRQQDYPSLSKVEVQKGEEFLYEL